MPVVAGMAALAIILFANIGDPQIALYIQATCSVAGYVGGALYSLSYLRKAAECESWTKCTRPAIVTFAVLNTLGCALNVYLLTPRTPFSIAILVSSNLVSLIAVAVITSSGFAAMSSQTSAPPDTIHPEESLTASNRLGTKFKRRLLGACAGLVGGAVVGFGISVYMDHGRPTTSDIWQTRLLIALVVVGIGALLGLVSGPPQK